MNRWHSFGYQHFVHLPPWHKDHIKNVLFFNNILFIITNIFTLRLNCDAIQELICEIQVNDDQVPRCYIMSLGLNELIKSTSLVLVLLVMAVNTLRPRQNGCRFPNNIFKQIFMNKNIWISIKFSLKFVPKGPINNIPALVQIMALRRPGGKPLSEPMMVILLMHICVTRPQWVNTWREVITINEAI